MALILQNDEGSIAGANIYIDLAYFADYCSDHGYDIASYDNAKRSIALIKGTQYLDVRFEYRGYRKNANQSTEFPRSQAYDDRQDAVIGIVDVVKKACAEYSYRYLIGGELLMDPSRDVTGRVILSKEETIGPITEKTEYYKHSIYEFPDYPLADRLLMARGLVISKAKTSNTSIQMASLGRS